MKEQVIEQATVQKVEEERLPDPRRLTWGERLRSNLLWGPLIYGSTAAFGSVSLVASLADKNGRWQHRIAHAWAKTVLRAVRIRLTVLGGESLRRHPVAVYACNHLSYMDTPVIFAALPFQFRILARHDLWKLPFIGWHLHRSGQIPVNADNPRASISSLNGGVKALKAGMPLFIFPEGGRAPEGHLQEFMSGPAYMAVRAQVPLVPMALVGTYELLPMHAKHLQPRAVKVVVGEPIDTTGYTTKGIEELTARLRDAIAELYYAHAALTRPDALPVEEPVA